MSWRGMERIVNDETGELAATIRAQMIARSRRALVQARGHLQKLRDFLPEGGEDVITKDDLSIDVIDEALARYEERLLQLARRGEEDES